MIHKLLNESKFSITTNSLDIHVVVASQKLLFSMVMDRRLCRICQSSEADIDLHRSGKICTSLLLNTLSSQELTFLHLQITLLHPSLTASMHGASTWCQPAKVSSNCHLSSRTKASITSVTSIPACYYSSSFQ